MAGINHDQFHDEIPVIDGNIWGPGVDAPAPEGDPTLLDADERGVLDVDALYGLVYSVPQILTHVLNHANFYEDPPTLSSFWRAAVFVTSFADITDESAIMAAIMMHTMTPFVEDDHKMTPADGETVIRQAAAALLTNQNQCTTVVAPTIAQRWGEAIVAGGAFHGFTIGGNPVNALPMPAVRYADIATADAIRFIRWVEQNCKPPSWKSDMIGLHAALMIAIPRRGTILPSKIKTVATEVRTSFGVELPTQIGLYRALYASCGRFITAENARDLFHTWNSAIPGSALRLRLTLQQAAGSGLTAIATITKALRRHPKFYWGRLAHMFPEETQKVIAALRTIANNPYFGFNGDLGIVKSSGYPNWCWAAKELLIKVDGDSSLLSYAGWVSRPAFFPRLQEMLLAYQEWKVNSVGEAPDETELEQAGMIKALVEASTTIGL